MISSTMITVKSSAPIKKMRSIARKVQSLTTLHSSKAVTNSKGVMLAHQHKLQRLPVAPLYPMLEKYLETVRPRVTDEKLLKIAKMVRKFGEQGGYGEKLHNLLRERAHKKEDWLTDVWLQTDYLNFRKSTVGYYNPAIIYPFPRFKTKDEQLKFSATIVCGMLDFKALIDQHQLIPDTMHGQLLDMTQYLKMFSSCRVPDTPFDTVAAYSQTANPPKHIVVAHNSHFFEVDVYDTDSNVIEEGQLFSIFKSIVQQTKTAAPPVGIFTTLERDKWKKIYDLLLIDNQKAVESIQKSLFVLSLDKAIPFKGDYCTHAVNQVLHGGGVTWNSSNRWFDKNLQVVVSEDGVFGINNEHSPVDGIPFCRLMDHAIEYLKRKPEIDSSKTAQPDLFRPVNFKLSEELLNYIEKAKADLLGLIKDMDYLCLPFSEFGKNFIKHHDLSPDGFVQMAVHLTFYKLLGLKGAQFESSTLRKFLHGRLGYLRVTTADALKFCMTMLNPNATEQDKIYNLRSAVDAHKDQIRQVSSGFGMDHLFFALMRIAEDNNLEIPEIFQDIVFTENVHVSILSSNAVSQEPAFTCFGPLVDDGYSCCYIFYPDSIHFGIGALNICPDTSAELFKETLIKSLMEMKSLVESEKAT